MSLDGQWSYHPFIPAYLIANGHLRGGQADDRRSGRGPGDRSRPRLRTRAVMVGLGLAIALAALVAAS
jgi:hypothetical protein